MTLSPGDRLPAATFLEFGPDGPAAVASDAVFQGLVVAFAVPGAFTPTCHQKHVPSFVEAMDALTAKGVASVVCISVNDPFVMNAWGDASGAAAAGIRMLADSNGTFTKAIGLDFTADPVGLIGRSQRYAMIVQDGTVQHLMVEESPGEADRSSATEVLARL